MEIAHFGISVRDLERSVAWYRDVFGFEEVKRFEKPEFEIKAVVVKRGNVSLEILQPGKPQAAPESGNDLAAQLRTVGANHFAVNVDDVKSLYHTLKAKNACLVTGLIDQRLFFCKDPDGSLIEVRQAG
jgi:methylmalonyl-CoA/ethylmalonyl-CoA epimerase